MSGRNGAMWIAIVVIAACSQSPSKQSAPGVPTAPGQATWQRSTRLGVQVAAPSDARLQEMEGHAFFGNATFKLNLFVVDDYSAASADEQKQLLENTLGFVKLTKQQVDGESWRFDYELERGKAGTISRIHAGRALDCGVHAVTAEVAAAVGDACTSVKTL